MLTIIIMTMSIITDQLGLSENELYEQYLEALKNKEKDIEDPEYSKTEIYLAFYILKITVLSVIPASLLIYRSRLLSLQAFKTMKKH